MAVVNRVVVNLLREGRQADLKAAGVSMLPMLWPRMALHVEPRNAEDIKRGDIVVYISNSDKLIAHRVVATDAQYIVTRGDSCLTSDPLFDKQSIAGVVTKVRVLGRYFSTINLCSRLYAKVLFALSPLSYYFNHLMAMCVMKFLIIRGQLRDAQ